MNWHAWKQLKKSIIGTPKRRRPPSPSRLGLETLEQRLAPAASVLTYHNDIASTGLNAAESQLSPANVKVGSFGKLFTTAVDGQVYAQPLVAAGVNITAGPNTQAGSTGVHDVVYVATENDSLYALDSSITGGALLWKRSFLDTANSANNTLGATSITVLTNNDVGSTDIQPNIGITGTPVIDGTLQTLYLVTKTKEVINGNTHFVQRLHAIALGDGTDRTTPYLLGDTTNGNTNNTSIYVYGTGDGNVTDPYNGTGKAVVQFNALREHQRGALNLVNNTLAIEWASHGDQGPYHGWVATWDVSNITANGLKLTGVLNTSPNGSAAGIWQGGGRLAYEPDGSAFYFETGNGFGSQGTASLDANGFPTNGSYYEALVKAVADPTSTPTNQNKNGWGLKVQDYFIPYNQVALDNADRDFGSAAPLVLPDSAGIPGHPHLLVATGKEGKLYLVDRDNMGKFDTNNDHVVNAVPNGSGNNTPPVLISGGLNTAAFFNNTIYVVSGYSGSAFAVHINSNGTLSSTSQTSATFGYLPGSPSISANGTTGGIVWVMDRNANLIRAYDASTLATELWDSGQKAGNADNLGAVVKFANPTVVNGEVFVGTSNSLVVYGLTPPANSVPAAPVLAAATLSGTSINLTWTDPTTAPNLATGYLIESSTGGGAYTQITTAPAGSKSIAIGGLTPQTTYSFRIRGVNGLGNSNYSNVATAATNNQVAILDFTGGFVGATTKLTLNGSTVLNGTKLELTNGGANEAGSAFSTSPVDITKFSSQFTFQSSAGAATADGFTFTIQGVGPTALGPTGGGLGYGTDGQNAGGTIGKSVAIKFDLYSNNGEGVNSTGLFTLGASPTNTGSIDLTPSGLDLHSGDVFQVNVTYDGATLTVIIKDTQTGISATQTYSVNIPTAVGGTTGYVGFTAGTGGQTTTADILTWSFSPNASQSPNGPTALGGSPASATTITLTWTNNATNQTGFHLDRATDAGFTQNLITQTLPATPNSFTDSATGLAPGSTFYYRLRAFNTAGDSANSNPVAVFIPVAPAKPSNALVTGVSSTEIDLSWTDNAGITATGYLILRKVGSGSFTNYASLPAASATPPSTYTWNDTGLTPGTAYEYHIEAVNVSGNNDFVGANAITLTTAPTGVTASAASGVVTLSWTPVAAALSYTIYRGSSANGEGTTPFVTGLTSASYTDSSVTNGNTYFYVVTAVNANVNHVPVLPAESARSGEVSATPTSTSFVAHINFSSSTTQIPTGYVNDGGQAYGLHANGQTYGWLAPAAGGGKTPTDNSVNARDRDVSNSPDELHDSLVHLQKPNNPNACWEIAVPNGVYQVHVIAGDPSFTDSVFVTTAEGVEVIHGTPTSSNLWFENTITVTVSDGRLTIANGTGAQNNKIDSIDITQVITPTLNYGSGFTGATGLTTNGSATLTGGKLELTNGGSGQAGSVFSSTQVATNSFTTTFNFQITNPSADGFTFTIQGVSPTALGPAGGGLGYGPDNTGGAAGIAKSLAIKFDLYNNAGEGVNSTGLFLNGQSPTINGVAPSSGSVDYTNSGIDLHSGHVFTATIVQSGGVLKVTLTDSVTKATATQTYSLNVGSVIGSSTAYVGFTGGTGGLTATQDILNWQFTSLS